MSDNKIYVHLVVDASGSMGGREGQTISALNLYIENLKKESKNATISLTTFEGTSVNNVRQAVNINDFTPITNDDYRTGGSTPLYDAIGKTISYINNNITLEESENVALVILTDGYENSSTSYNSASVKELLDQKQKENWFITYLGANQDGFSTGQKLGVLGTRSATFDMANIGSTMSGIAASTASYNLTSRTDTSKMDFGYSDDLRKSFVSQPNKVNTAGK